MGVSTDAILALGIQLDAREPGDGSKTRAWRGHPKRVAGLAMAEDDEKKVRDFIAKHNLKTTGEFGWHIFSMWS